MCYVIPELGVGVAPYWVVLVAACQWIYGYLLFVHLVCLDCENLLKKFLVLNPVKRATLEVSTHEGREERRRLLDTL